MKTVIQAPGSEIPWNVAEEQEGSGEMDVAGKTTLEQTAPETSWEMMNRRWDIEENGFHQLKTYYHAKHCYCHAAVEVIFNLMIIGFNMRELYLYRRIQKFERSRITRKSVSRMFRADLLTEKIKQILYQKGG